MAEAPVGAQGGGWVGATPALGPGGGLGGSQGTGKFTTLGHILAWRWQRWVLGLPGAGVTMGCQRDSAGCRGAQWGARGGSTECQEGRRNMRQLGEQGGTTDLQAWSTPKNGRASCVSPALSPSLTPWPGCALGLVNPQRPEWGPPRWCELTRWPLDLCHPCVPPIPSAPCVWLELGHPSPCLSFPSQPAQGRWPPHFQVSSCLPGIGGA